MAITYSATSEHYFDGVTRVTVIREPDDALKSDTIRLAFTFDDEQLPLERVLHIEQAKELNRILDFLLEEVAGR